MSIRRKFVVFDNETTGLTLHPLADRASQPRIIEFAGILTDGKEVLDSLEFLCHPGIEIYDEITRITGITNLDLRDQPSFDHFVPKVRELFSQADAAIAHNLSFDQSLLKYDLERFGLTLQDIQFPKIKLCTVEQTAPFYGRRMRLQELFQNVTGEVYVQKHRALDDVLLLHRVCQELGVYDAFSAA